jgi:hypothetical protein
MKTLGETKKNFFKNRKKFFFLFGWQIWIQLFLEKGHCLLIQSQPFMIKTQNEMLMVTKKGHFETSLNHHC